MTDTAPPEMENQPTVQEAGDLLAILGFLRELRRAGGWGTVTVILKGGDICEAVTSASWKPPKPKGQPVTAVKSRGE
jgi:hypothetical protein